ncbi:MAG TPA: GxxExxY protein [Verrucomicrobiae bacterium]|nr:GxxExxY protein [Verrucomicrobiae bacterium]
MDTDSRIDLQHPENTNLLLKEETHQILGCAFDVLNEIGHGFHEKVYENALVVEFRLRGIPYEQQKRFPIIYKGALVAEFVPDLIAFGSVIVDTKVIERITDHEHGRMNNYLKITKLRVGLTLNFKNPRLEWDRWVL